MNNLDHISERLETIFWVIKIIQADPAWKKFVPGSGIEKIRIPDKHPGSATLPVPFLYFNGRLP
jgi:hypothetical protein